MDRRTLLTLLASSAVAGPARAVPRFSRALTPGHLNAHCGAWDSKSRSTLVFGGADDRQVLDAFWQYRAGRWRALPSAPPPRTFAAAAYDFRRKRFVLVGGNRVLFGAEGATDTLLDDHWEWDGRQWRQFPGATPPARSEAACAFDPGRGSTILFGGWRWQDGRRIRLNDLWEYDGREWTRSEAAGPEPRSGCTATYDHIAKRILIAGGNGSRSDFWAFDGRSWARLKDLPQGRLNPAFAFDSARRAALMVGGWTGQERISATALFKQGEWRLLSGLEPPPRNHSLLVPVDDGSRLMLIGGHNGAEVLGDQWQWDGKWSLLRFEAPKTRIENGH